jgi:hypothetical protein
LWNEELLEHVQIHDIGNGRLHEEEGAVHCYVHETCSVLLHHDRSKRCVCPLCTFVYSFKVVKLFLKHSVLLFCYFILCLGRTFSSTSDLVYVKFANISSEFCVGGMLLQVLNAWLQ